jgi:hypothetical protein
MRLWILGEKEIIIPFATVRKSRKHDLVIDFKDYEIIMYKCGRLIYPDNRKVDWIHNVAHADVIEEIKKHLLLEQLKREVEV